VLEDAAPTFSKHMETTFIGVDPALRKGGFWVAIICRVDNTVTFKACEHLGVFVQMLIDLEPKGVIVENSNLQKAFFNQKAGTGGALDVGKNMGISQAATDIARGFSSIEPGISPKQKGAKITNEAVFRGILRANNLTPINYKGNKTEQDKRDALQLALICEQQVKLNSKRNAARP